MTAQPEAAIEQIPVPARRFSHVHVDLVSPLPTSADGYSYIFTAVDRSTRWLEAIPFQDMAASSCADALISGWVSSSASLQSLLRIEGPNSPPASGTPCAASWG